MRARAMDAMERWRSALGRAGGGFWTCAILAVALGACTDATDVERLEISASGAVAGQAYLDLNGNETADGPDDPVADASVVLTAAAGGTSVIETETDAEGLFVFEEVPVGTYTVTLAEDVLGDSLLAVDEAEPFQVTMDTANEVVLGATYPELPIEEVREAEPGRRVFTSGIALNPRQSFSDGRVFLEGEEAYLQATDVGRTPAVAVGDSVRFLGRTARRDGRPALDDVTPIILIPQARVPVPREISTGDAATAGGGPLDAALVRIRSAEVSDTMTVEATGDFHFTADDGSGPVEVVLRAFLGFPVQPDEEDVVSQAVGLLAPYDDGSGNVRWRLLVRSASEFGLEP
ncbi:MAG: carboxypeptidase-like regulatory domain-containing protein [Gemmatimonadota bacterium]|nr:carboxypeptidase-like regulatory domain-containing protein [Gemmatimonadota bacterium]